MYSDWVEFFMLINFLNIYIMVYYNDIIIRRLEELIFRFLF